MQAAVIVAPRPAYCRFKCLVSKDGSFNLESTYCTFPELWFPEWEFRGTPWTNRASYRKWSPHEWPSSELLP
jgi:dipeptidyl aminopeptidase/acylaminoacyl peptidase